MNTLWVVVFSKDRNLLLGDENSEHGQLNSHISLISLFLVFANKGNIMAYWLHLCIFVILVAFYLWGAVACLHCRDWDKNVKSQLTGVKDYGEKKWHAWRVMNGWLISSWRCSSSINNGDNIFLLDTHMNRVVFCYTSGLPVHGTCNVRSLLIKRIIYYTFILTFSVSYDS